jgi:hypothetical protein
MGGNGRFWQRQLEVGNHNVRSSVSSAPFRIVTLANSVRFRTYNEGFGKESRSRIAVYVVAIAFMVVGYPVCGDCSQYLAVAEDAQVTPQVAC